MASCGAPLERVLKFDMDLFAGECERLDMANGVWWFQQIVDDGCVGKVLNVRHVAELKRQFEEWEGVGIADDDGGGR